MLASMLSPEAMLMHTTVGMQMRMQRHSNDHDSKYLLRIASILISEIDSSLPDFESSNFDNLDSRSLESLRRFR